jgi:hypothetical protein
MPLGQVEKADRQLSLCESINMAVAAPRSGHWMQVALGLLMGLGVTHGFFRTRSMPRTVWILVPCMSWPGVGYLT